MKTIYKPSFLLTMQMKLIVLLCQKALGSSWMTEESKAESRPMLARITDHHHYHHSAPKFEKKKSHINFIRREFLYKNKLISSHYCYYTYCKFSPLFYPLRTPHKSIHFGICHFPYFYCWSIHDDLLPPSLIIKTRWNTHDSCWPNQKGVTVISILIHNTYIDKMLLQK